MLEHIDDVAHAIPLRSYLLKDLGKVYADTHIDEYDDTIYIKDIGWHWDNAQGYADRKIINDEHKKVLDKYTSLQFYTAYIGLPADCGYSGPE